MNMTWAEVAEEFRCMAVEAYFDGTPNAEVTRHTNVVWDAMQEMRMENARLTQELKLALLSK